MKAVIIFLLNFLAVATAFSQAEFQLVIEDNFDSARLNRAIWDTRYSWGRTISNNHELQYYTDTGNIVLENGVLKLIARKEQFTGKVDSLLPDSFVYEGNLRNLSTFSFTSGMICSKENFLYGKFEIKCRLPKGAGMWPAFWMFIGYPADEIDWFESRGEWKKRLSCGIHSYDSVKYRKPSRWKTFPRKNFIRQFQTVTCFWYPDLAVWQVDGKEMFRFTTNYPTQYKRPMPLITNLAVCNGGFSGPPKKNEKFPKAFEIDYIKVWKLVTPQP